MGLLAQGYGLGVVGGLFQNEETKGHRERDPPEAPQAFLVPLCPVKHVGHSQVCAGEVKVMKKAELHSSIIWEDFAGFCDLDERRIF
jgi:hypothetical protein